jgi:hypothetical protein
MATARSNRLSVEVERKVAGMTREGSWWIAGWARMIMRQDGGGHEHLSFHVVWQVFWHQKDSAIC